MPRRRSGLRPGGPLKRNTSLRRTGRLSLRAVTTQSPEEKRGKRLVKKRSGGLCEVCGERRAAEWQHRKRRTQGGTWCPSNGLHCCVSCHSWITGNGLAARPGGWNLWRRDVPADEPVLRRGSWVRLTPDGGLVAVLRHTGGPEQCESELECPEGGGLRCGLGEWHDGDHECGLVAWPVTSEERAAWRITV
jgi:hypothetical protein